MIKRRTVAPGEVELSIVATLQFIVTLALVAAPPTMLIGNGTSLLLAANYPSVTYIVRSAWAIIFFTAGALCVRAVRNKTVDARKWAWQIVIPLWAAWLSGLVFPLIMGQPTNVIMLSAAAALVLQWMVTRILVPLDSHWYSREVPIEAYQGEGLLSVANSSGGSSN